MLKMLVDRKLYHNFEEASSLESDSSSINKMSNLIMVLMAFAQYGAKNGAMKFLHESGIDKERLCCELK